MLVGVDEVASLISDCGTDLGGMRIRIGSQGLTSLSAHNAVSADGDTVFFTADKCGSSPPADELFARIDNGQPDAHTVAISEPSAEDCAQLRYEPGREEANFEGASADGTKVFFVTEQPLLGGDSTQNIYEYDFSAPPGERVHAGLRRGLDGVRSDGGSAGRGRDLRGWLARLLRRARGADEDAQQPGAGRAGGGGQPVCVRARRAVPGRAYRVHRRPLGRATKACGTGNGSRRWM